MLTVTSPVDNLQTNIDWVAVTGYTEIGSTIKVNGTPVSTDQNGNFGTTVNLVSGNNTITIVSTDAVTNTTTITRNVGYDNIPPSLTVTAPLDNQQTPDNWIAVTGYVEVGSTMEVNGSVVSTDVNGNFSTTVNLLPGSNTLAIIATDAAGNTTTVIRNVVSG